MNSRINETAQPSNSVFRRIAPLFAAMFFGFATIGVPLPALPLHVHLELGFGTALAGLTVGIQSLATVLTRAYAGRSVDRVGSKITLIRGLLVCATSGLVYLLSVTLPLTPVPSLAVLLAGRLLLGVGESQLITGLLSWAVLRAGPGRSGQAMSWNGMAQYAALAVGAPAGFAAYQAFGFASVCWATIVLPLIALAIVVPLTPAAAQGGSRLPLWHVVGLIWKPGMGLLLAGIGFSTVSAFASLDFAAKGWPGAGAALSAFGGAFVVPRLVGGGLPDRLGGRHVGALSMLVSALGQILFWLAPNPAAAFVGAAFTGLGCSLVFPALGVEMLRNVPVESRGVALGAFAAFQDVAIGLTGPVLGLLAAYAGSAAPFAVGALTALAGTIVTLALPRVSVPSRGAILTHGD